MTLIANATFCRRFFSPIKYKDECIGEVRTKGEKEHAEVQEISFCCCEFVFAWFSLEFWSTL
jgi:hypothetical protein